MSNAIKVGLFAFVALAILGYLILRVEDLSLFDGEVQRAGAVFDSVAGLDDKATVRIAGVRVGRVDGIELSGRKARVNLRLETPVALTQGSRARIANLGLLGEKYVELIPGPEGAPLLGADDLLPGETPPSFDDAMAQLGRVGESIEEITGSLTGGEQDLFGDVGELVATLTATAEEIRALVAVNRQEITATVHNFETMSGDLAVQLPLLASRMQEVLDQVSGVLAENRGHLAGSLENVESLTEDLQVTVGHLNEISGKIARGEGTIGKLVNSDEAHDELVSTLGSIESGVETLTDTLGRAQRLKLRLGLESFYLEDSEESQSTFQVDLEPGGESQHLYRLGVVDRPQGDRRVRTQLITTTAPDGTRQTQQIETITTDDDPVFSALFGYRTRRDARLWAGLIEEEFGVQVEYPLLKQKLWLSLEAFDFDRQDDLNPHLRLSTRWWLHRNLFLVGGYDDALESDRNSIFLGGGLRWGDDDLKYLLGSVPRF